MPALTMHKALCRFPLYPVLWRSVLLYFVLVSLLKRQTVRKTLSTFQKHFGELGELGSRPFP